MIKTVGLFTDNSSTKQYSPISFSYFLNMELANGGGGKEVIKQNGKLNKIKDIIITVTIVSIIIFQYFVFSTSE